MTLLIDHISFERQYQSILDQIHIELHPGELLQITGPNGSGKSTLLRILAGLIRPESGQVLWHNQCIFSECDEYAIQYIGHQNGIRPQLTVYENIRLFQSITSSYPSSPLREEGDDAILNYLKLHAFKHTQAARLSAGQLRRLSFSRLLLSKAPLWILDEPTTALDQEGQTLITELLENHLNQQGLAVIATHHALTIKAPLKTLTLKAHHD